jgi:hypothetical protein
VCVCENTLVKVSWQEVFVLARRLVQILWDQSKVHDIVSYMTLDYILNILPLKVHAINIDIAFRHTFQNFPH